MHKQRTIKSAATIRGIGLQTGNPVKVKLIPAPPGTGIIFIRTDMPGAPRIEVNPDNLKDSGRIMQRTVLRSGKAQVHTSEHFLAALSGFYIDNLIVEIDNTELPGLDGSAKEFANLLRDAGVHRQDALREIIEIERPFVCSNDKASIQIIPDDKFSVEYFLDYDHRLLKEQWFDVVFDNSDNSIDFFANEVAPSRTFCLERDAMAFLRSGLGKGADLGNTLVIGEEGPINNKFRYPNEPARHKLLDLVGDLYILGRHIKGRIVAKKSGHRLNNIFVKRLREEADKNLVETRQENSQW